MLKFVIWSCRDFQKIFEKITMVSPICFCPNFGKDVRGDQCKFLISKIETFKIRISFFYFDFLDLKIETTLILTWVTSLSDKLPEWFVELEPLAILWAISAEPILDLDALKIEYREETEAFFLAAKSSSGCSWPSWAKFGTRLPLWWILKTRILIGSWYSIQRNSTEEL